MTDKPCPLCGGTDLERHTQYLGWDELQELAMEEWADDVGGLLMVECRGCFCRAPVQTWNMRPDQLPIVRWMAVPRFEEKSNDTF